MIILWAIQVVCSAPPPIEITPSQHHCITEHFNDPLD